MRPLLRSLVVFFLCLPGLSHASVLGRIRGVVHDSQHRPVGMVEVVLQALHSDFILTAQTGAEGLFDFAAVPLGEYTLTLTHEGFSRIVQPVRVASGMTSSLHFNLLPETVAQSVTVTDSPPGVTVDGVTPTTLITRSAIEHTPGASRTNGLQMITDYVPGAYVTHDQLHLRGGHQVSWLIDGVQIPNTNIAGNLGAQIDPEDIGYLEVQRGSYGADLGDRTYGIFNVVPRSGFDQGGRGEAVLGIGNFGQLESHVSFGNHTERLAYYVSGNANRTSDGLAPPVEAIRHDAANGLGALGSLLYNRAARDQFRAVAQTRRDYFQIPYDPDPASAGNAITDTSALRDGQHEMDAFADGSWVHTFTRGTVLQMSPFYHFNRTSYDPSLNDRPVATRSDRSSSYTGAQASVVAQLGSHVLQAGLFGFGQRDHFVAAATYADGSVRRLDDGGRAEGRVVEAYGADSYHVSEWLTVTGGLRASRFDGDLSEAHFSPRLGAAVQLPRLHWVVRGFYGRFYQPPPLLTVSAPLSQFAQAQSLSFRPLSGETDEEHQAGLQIPFHDWVLDVDMFATRARNYLDHANIGESSLYFPVTVNGALIRAWEVTLRSPPAGRLGSAHAAYSNQRALQRGGLTGGLVCGPEDAAECPTGFSYSPLDHDQRHTLSAGVETRLPKSIDASADLSYGSGFHNGLRDARNPGEYLPQHASLDLMVGREFGAKTRVAVVALNVANQRRLLDNSLTFGGFHFSDPRQVYVQVRYRFHE